jgi:actin cytoskeleton-regulatory complex protein SLA1
MAEESDEYLAVLKASYSYDPQSDEEITIKEDQLLFLLQKTDEEYL